MFLRVFSLSLGLGSLVGLGGVMLAGVDLQSAAFITAISAGPAILSDAVIAAQLARIAARAHPAWQPRDWRQRGALFGAAGGGSLLALWIVLFNLPAGGPPLAFVALMAAVGGVAGGAIGLAVGWYSSQFVRDARLRVDRR